MSLSLLSVIVLSTAVMNVEVDALPYLDPPSPWWPSYSYALRGGSSILREQGEKLLLNEVEPDPYGINAVIVLIDAEYDWVRNAVRGLVEARWGILDEQENITRPIKMKPATAEIIHEALHWPILGEGLVRLSDQASMKTAREYQLTSQPYNKIESLRGFSQVVIRVSDGATLFDQPVTILQVTRTDRLWEWAREFHGLIPLPYKEERWSVGIVTSTEITLIEDLKKQMPGLSIRYFLSDSSGDVRGSGGVREKMEEAIEQLKKP
ncbi:MAG: hypothetical protein E8D46_00875 [Nitrospira sp.]|nr:MAG: hypothetical protein E8D46_00875 [Nitrospira sp.]